MHGQWKADTLEYFTQISNLGGKNCTHQAQLGSSEFMGKTFQAAQLTNERFLTIDHSCKI
jgi:hypothetical protein